MAQSGKPPAVWAKGLVRRFGKTVAVDNVDLAIQPGEFYGLLGQNGAGKTTTIKTIVGLLRPNAGTVGIGEFDTWKSPTEVKSRIGVLPEEFNLYERLTGAELLDFTAAMHGLGRTEAATRRNELLELLDLTNAGSKLISDYSRGMRKKVALGAAIIHRPPVLFLDEPFEGVDAVSATFDPKSASAGSIWWHDNRLLVTRDASCREALYQDRDHGRRASRNRGDTQRPL